jgi:hypothetical protein
MTAALPVLIFFSSFSEFCKSLLSLCLASKNEAGQLGGVHFLVAPYRSIGGFRGSTVGQFVAWLRQIPLRTGGRTVLGLLDELRPDQGPPAAFTA